MHLGHVGVDGDGRQLAHDVEALAQGLVYVGVVRVFVVVVQGDEGVLQLVHQVFSRQPQEVHFQKVVGQVVIFLEDVAEGVQLFPRRQVAEQEEEAGFYVQIAVVAFLFRQIADI